MKQVPNLIPEFERCVREAQPKWFLMENVAQTPIPDVQGYNVHSQIVNNRWYDSVQSRQRSISFGTRNGLELHIPKQKEVKSWRMLSVVFDHLSGDEPKRPGGLPRKIR